MNTYIWSDVKAVSTFPRNAIIVLLSSVKIFFSNGNLSLLASSRGSCFHVVLAGFVVYFVVRRRTASMWSSHS